jgi:acylphosphatase
MHQVRLVIEGRVQGVGFRWFAQNQARALGLTGAVRNRPDGAVEIEAEGDLEKLGQFVESMRHGPRSAHVGRVDTSWSEGPARHREFVIAA